MIRKHSAAMRQLLQLGSAASWTDGQLLARFTADGDETAFEALVERHGVMVMRVCRSVLGDAHEAQDAFQATFVVLLRNGSSIRRPEALGAWLHGVARRVSARARREATHRRVVERAAVDRREANEAPAWCPELHEEIDCLPERYRAAVVLCGLEGQTHEEAARQLGWPVGTVKVRLMRGRARLRDRLIRRGLAPVAAAFAVAGREAAACSHLDAPIARIGPISTRAAALARSTSTSLFMAKLTTIAASIVVGGGVLLAGWGLRSSIAQSDAPKNSGATVAPTPRNRAAPDNDLLKAHGVTDCKQCHEPPHVSAPEKLVAQLGLTRADPAKGQDAPPAYDDRLKDFQMATIGNMGPAVEDKVRGYRTEAREAILKKSGEVWIWNMWEKTLVAGPLRHEDEPIKSIEVLDGAKLLVTKSGETMRVWDALTGKFKGQMTAQHVSQNDFNCHQEIGRLVTIGKDNQSITVYDPDDLKPLATFKTSPHDIVSTAISQNGKIVATFGGDRTIQLWDIASRKAFVTLEPPSAAVGAMYKEDGHLDRNRFTDSWEFWRLVSSVMPKK